MFVCGCCHRCAFRAAAAGIGYGDQPAGGEFDGRCRRPAHLRRHMPDLPWAGGRRRSRPRRPRTQHHGPEARRRRRRPLPHHPPRRVGHTDAALQRTARRAGVAARQLHPQPSEHGGIDGRRRAAQQSPEGDVAAGEALFFGRAGCASCHEINARGGVTGPDLSNAGRLTAAALRQKIVSPNEPLPPAPGAAAVAVVAAAAHHR